MGLIDTVLNRLGYAKIAANAVRGTVPLAMAGDYAYGAYGYDPTGAGDHIDAYKRLSWINAAIMHPCNLAASVAFNVYSLTGEKRADIPNHPFELLLNRPNPLMSRAEFLLATFAFYRVCGNAYWWINAPDGGAPLELWVIPSNQIQPVTDSRLFISHYEYNTLTGSKMELPPSQIVHFKRFNPEDPFIGASELTALELQAQAEYGRVRTDKRLNNDNNGSPPSILAFADSFTDTEWERMKASVDENARQMRRYMLLRNVKAGGVQWLSAQMSARDLQTLEQRQFSKEEIWAVLAPGLASMLAINANEANAKTGKATLTEFVLWPMLNAIAEKISSDLLPLYASNLAGAFDEVRTKDRVLELQEMVEYSRTHTVQEVRAKYWMDDPLGDPRDNLMPAQINAATGDGSKPPEPEIIQVTPQPAQPEGETVESEQPQTEPDEADADLKRWKRIARKAIKAGKPVPEFKSNAIPLADILRISTALQSVTDAADLDAIFSLPADPLIETLRQATALLGQLTETGR